MTSPLAARDTERSAGSLARLERHGEYIPAMLTSIVWFLASLGIPMAVTCNMAAMMAAIFQL